MDHWAKPKGEKTVPASQHKSQEHIGNFVQDEIILSAGLIASVSQ